MLKAIVCFTAVFIAISAAALEASQAKALGGVKGDWDATFTIADQTVDGTISLDLNGKALTGSVFTVHTGKGTITDGTFENNKLSCTLKFEQHESIALIGEFKNDRLSGTFATEGMTGSWTAVKKK